MMKKLFVFASILAVLIIGCAKEEQLIEEPVSLENEEQAPALTFNFSINHSSLDNPATKAVKSGWEVGDKVFVFFSTVATPKHLELTYDGTDWTATEMNGKNLGSIGLADNGTMTAVYLPFGNDATVETKSGRFAFDQTDYAYYLSCVNVPYTLSGTEGYGTLNMDVPDGFVQFFVTDADAVEGNALLREAHITPKAVTGVNTDGSLAIETKAEGTQMPGFVYGIDATKGYLFSGELADAARGVSTDYHFNMVVGATSKVLEGTKTMHSGTVGNYSHRAIKFPALSSWSDGSDEIIEFADNSVKNICVDSWDTNDDGELSFSEASAVNTIGTSFSQTTITSFEELRFFTGLSQIGYHAFYQTTELKKVILPVGISKIGEDAFYRSGIESIEIPSSVLEIESYAFDGSSLLSITIPDTVSALGEGAFRSCNSLATVIMSNNITAIEQYTFAFCRKLTEIVLSNSLESIGFDSFVQCEKLETINIPNSVQSIEARAFSNCSKLQNVSLPNTLQMLKYLTFSYCTSLSSIQLPSSLTCIDYSVFLGCSNLSTIELPSSVGSIGLNAFYHCINLSYIQINSTTPPVLDAGELGTGAHWFDDTNECPIYVPAASVDDYKTATNWSDYAERIQTIH